MKPSWPSRGRVLLACGGLLALSAAAIPGARFYQKHARALNHLKQADFEASRYRYENAYQHILRAVEYWPERGEIRLQAARWARCAGKPDEAAPHLDIADRLLPDSDDVRLERLMLIAQRAEASPFVVDSLMMRAKSDAVRRELIYDALTRGFLSTYRIRHAKLVLEDWFKQPTDNPWPYYWRGIVAEQTSENLDDAAVADFSRVLELDPDRTQARERLGRLLLKQNETAKARPHFEELFRRNENSVTALVGLARCEAFAGETNSARAHLDRALQIDSNHTEALRERASLAIHADGKPADAEPLLRKALAIQPHDPATLYLLVVCLQRMGNDVEARTQEQRYLELVRKHSRLKSLVVFELQKRPNDPDLLHEIGVLFLEGGLPAQEERGIYWLQRALEIAPRHAPTLKTLIALFESKNRSDLSEPLRLRLAPQQ